MKRVNSLAGLGGNEINWRNVGRGDGGVLLKRGTYLHFKFRAKKTDAPRI